MTSIRSIGGFEYQAPTSLDETLNILQSDGGGTKIMAGGTDLILQIKLGQLRPSLVVDVKKVPELNRLEWSQSGGLRIGAAVPLSKVLALSELPKEYGILLQACSTIGSMQIRNRGTIGGNICNAAPSADSVPALICLKARANLASTTGTRSIDMENLFTAPGETVIRNNELLIEIEVPTPPAPSAGCYLSHTTREEMDIAVTGVASFLTLSPQSSEIVEARIALGAVAPTPIRARDAEAGLAEKAITLEIIDKTAEKAAEAASPISDLRGSADYRCELIKILTRRTLRKACEDLGLAV
jgi:carbon-monoxide dehydrogenase medium subunit